MRVVGHVLQELRITGQRSGNARMRGAQINGIVHPIEDLAGVTAVGRLIAEGPLGVPSDVVDGYVGHAARKRVAYVVEPVRVVSWDHRKLSR